MTESSVPLTSFNSMNSTPLKPLNLKVTAAAAGTGHRPTETSLTTPGEPWEYFQKGDGEETPSVALLNGDLTTLERLS